MLKSSELRIGNYFQWSGFASMGIGVHHITHGQQIMDYIQLKEGVPLTKEWLEKFGFHRRTGINNDIPWYELSYAAFSFQWSEDERYDIGISIGDAYTAVPCKYIHQLQNLYFALTGKELELIATPQHS